MVKEKQYLLPLCFGFFVGTVLFRMIFCLSSRSEDLPQFPVDSGRYAAVRNAMTK
jgi:hypothetical protein